MYVAVGLGWAITGGMEKLTLKLCQLPSKLKLKKFCKILKNVYEFLESMGKRINLFRMIHLEENHKLKSH